MIKFNFNYIFIEKKDNNKSKSNIIKRKTIAKIFTKIN